VFEEMDASSWRGVSDDQPAVLLPVVIGELVTRFRNRSAQTSTAVSGPLVRR
jgi:hypothetical protein